MCMYVSLYVAYIYALGGQKRVLVSLDLELQAVYEHLVWVLSIKLVLWKSSHPAPIFTLKYTHACVPVCLCGDMYIWVQCLRPEEPIRFPGIEVTGGFELTDCFVLATKLGPFASALNCSAIFSCSQIQPYVDSKISARMSYSYFPSFELFVVFRSNIRLEMRNKVIKFYLVLLLLWMHFLKNKMVLLKTNNKNRTTWVW